MLSLFHHYCTLLICDMPEGLQWAGPLVIDLNPCKPLAERRLLGKKKKGRGGESFKNKQIFSALPLTNDANRHILYSQTPFFTVEQKVATHSLQPTHVVVIPSSIHHISLWFV